MTSLTLDQLGCVPNSSRNFPTEHPPISLAVTSAQMDEDEHSSEDEDELFAELEKDDFHFGGLRERRLEALKAEMDKAKTLRESDHGKLTEISNEKEVIQTSA